jgi:hypothetical protein
MAPDVGSMTGADGALLAHKTWRTLEPLHGMIYFVPEASEEYAKLGVDGRDGYFASRAAPMGAVSAEVVIATFFNFSPELVRASIPRAWESAEPADLLKARLTAVDRALRQRLGEDVISSPEMERAAMLARQAAQSCSSSIEGRPLCAAHTELAWPDEPHLDLWHAQSILREYRGDGHIAALVTHGLSGIDSLVTHASEGNVPASILQSTRGWSDDEWSSSADSLRSRGWLTSGSTLAFTELGASQRAEIELQTDVLATGPYATLGESACSELRRLVRPWSRILSEELVAWSVGQGS